MKKIYTIILSLVLITVSNTVYPQFKDWGTKFGLRFNLLFPENEFTNFGFGGNNEFSFNAYKISYLGETFLGINVSRGLEFDITVGIGQYAGKAYFKDSNQDFGKYNSTVIPVDLRFKINPWDNPKWNPYFYVGGGVIIYDLEVSPNILLESEKSEDAGTAATFPLGVGAEFKLSEILLFDLSLGSAITTSFELDGYKKNTEAKWDYYFNAGVGISLVSESCDSDRDNDGISRCEENIIGTDPKNPDTDRDGIADGDELYIYKTDPLKPDTDDDGINDYDEIFTYKTNPLSQDSDGDRISDGDEIQIYNINPLNPDTDHDDLSDYDEIFIYKTNPLSADTDGDGLSDGSEILRFNTDPLMIDTDGDGLSDGDEIIRYETDPNNLDTDGGSVDDFTEVRRGTDPNDPDDDIVKTGVAIVLEGITFATGKADITPESEFVLQAALETMLMNENIIVEISGHTDDVGSVSTNKALSQRRADSVRQWLINKGIAPDRIIAKGYGSDFPRVPNNSEENRRLNRRIEFKRIK